MNRVQSKHFVDEEGNDLETNWKSMKLPYKDYVLDEDRLEVLQELMGEFLIAQKQDILEYNGDPLSNATGVHVTGTEEQALCQKWFDKRVGKITASPFLVLFIFASTKNHTT